MCTFCDVYTVRCVHHACIHHTSCTQLVCTQYVYTPYGVNITSSCYIRGFVVFIKVTPVILRAPGGGHLQLSSVTSPVVVYPCARMKYECAPTRGTTPPTRQFIMHSNDAGGRYRGASLGEPRHTPPRTPPARHPPCLHENSAAATRD